MVGDHCHLATLLRSHPKPEGKRNWHKEPVILKYVRINLTLGKFTCICLFLINITLIIKNRRNTVVGQWLVLL